MWVDFDTLSLESRVWVFQSDRVLSENEQNHIDTELKDFVSQWSTHGSKMHASHVLLHNCFVVIAADEQMQAASGCSIDSFTTLFKKFGEAYSLSFFDRFAIAYKDNSEVVVKSLNAFKEAIKTKEITENTIVFNNLISTKKHLLSNWELPLHQSWHKRYL
jgi:hypothetical protein